MDSAKDTFVNNNESLHCRKPESPRQTDPHHDTHSIGVGTPTADSQAAVPMLEIEQQDGGDSHVLPAPDGGYGWFVVLGCFIVHIVLGGLERADGIYFLQFRKKFHQSAQLSAWPGALVSALRQFLGPLACAFSTRYSVRTSCLLGSLMFFLGLFLSGWAPNFYFLFFSHSFVQGVGRALVYAPGIILVGKYFDKWRGLAIGLSTSGVGVGTFLLVPFTQLMFDEFGYQSAFMIVGAIALNTAVSAMLYRPLSQHISQSQTSRNKKQMDLEENLVLSNMLDNADTQSTRSWQAYHSSASRHSIDKCHNDPTNCQIQEPSKSRGCFKSSLKVCFPVEGGGSKNDKSNREKVFNFQLLKNPSFLMMCFSISLFTAAFKSAFTFIPPLIKSFGFTESEAAFVLSIAGVADSVGRIMFGLVFDLSFVRPLRPVLYTTLIFLLAGVSFILPQIRSYVGLCLICALYGMLTGGYISQKSIINVDICGVANISSSFGLLIFFQSLGMCVGPPLSGALWDTFGSFVPAFYMGVGLMAMAGGLMVLCNIFLYRQRRQLKQQSAVS